MVGRICSNALIKSAGLPTPMLSAKADAKWVLAPTSTGTQMAVMVSSNRASGKTDKL